MLIRLTSSTSGEVVMFAKHARRLFEIIGKECTARGVFTFEQLPAALEQAWYLSILGVRPQARGQGLAQRLLAAAVGLLPALALMLALFAVGRICREYAAGRLFSDLVLGAYRRLGATLVATISNLMNVMNVDSYWQPLVIGLIILAGVTFDTMRSSNRLKFPWAKGKKSAKS